MSENEDRYHDYILDLEAKLKKNVDLILKLGNSLQGMFMLGPKPLSVYDQQLKHGLGYPNPYTLTKAISQCSKLYLASSLGNSDISLNVRDTEDTLDDASKSQQKVYEKINDPIAVANKQNCWTIDYAQINALYKDFRDIKEMKDVFESIESELCELEKQNDFLKDQLLEVSLKHEVELSVLLNHECVDNSLHDEIEELKKKSIEIQEGLQARIKILEKDVQRCEKQSVDFELTFTHEKEKHKWDSNLKNKNTNPLDYSLISKMEKLEDENVSLDFTMQSLNKEHDNVKLEYQQLFHLSIDTTSLTKQRGVNSNKNVIAPGMYKVVTTHESQTNEAKHDLSSTGMNAASSVRRPMNRDSHVKNSVLANSKKPTKKVAVYVRKNKQTDNTSENVISNKENVIDVDVANASKAKTLLCVSCMQNVLIPCHANFHKTRFSKESTLSKSLDTTYVVSKPKIDVGSTSKANDKVVQIVLWIVDSGCSKHMTGDRSLLKNFIEKFMGTVRFGNDNFAAITGYVPKLQTAEDLQGDALLHYDAEMELMNLILLSIPNDIYNSVDACNSAKDMWKRVERLMRGTIQNKVDKETLDMFVIFLRYYLQQFEKLVNVSRAKKLEKFMSFGSVAPWVYFQKTRHDYQQDDVHTNSEDPLTFCIKAIIQGDRVNIQSRNSGNAGRNNRRAYVQEEIETLQLFNATTVVEKDEARVILTDEQNDFLFADASRMEEIEELSVNICLIAKIQPADNTSNAGSSYDSAFISEVQSLSNTENKEQMSPTHTKIINSTIGDDQIDSDIIFDEPNGHVNVNSDSIEKDTHVPDLYALEQLARNAYQEAEKQQIFAQKIQQQNTTLTSQLELYKERVRVLENINGDNNYLNEFFEADKRAKYNTSCFSIMWLQQKMDKSAKRIATGVSGNMEGSQQMAFMSFSDVLYPNGNDRGTVYCLNFGTAEWKIQWVPPNGLGLIVVTDMAYFVESLGLKKMVIMLMFISLDSSVLGMDVISNVVNYQGEKKPPGFSLVAAILPSLSDWEVLPVRLDGGDEEDMESDPLTEEPLDTLLMGDEVISTTLARENDEFIKSSVADLVPIPMEYEVTSDSVLECDMLATTPLPTTDVREEVFDINLPLREYVVDFLMENEDVAGLPRHLVKYIFNHLLKNPSLTKGMSDEPLGDDLKSISYDVTFSNPLFNFNDDSTLCYDNPLFDEEFKDISILDPPESTPVIDESSLLVTPLPYE
ncbi:hypothetical protein Tco_1352606 [Tanacetum coccineum]